MEKKNLIEITYNKQKQEVITLDTDDLVGMNQYQRNRLPFTWELLDVKENDVCCGLQTFVVLVKKRLTFNFYLHV